MKFSIRDLILLTLCIATALGWYLDNKKLTRRAERVVKLEADVENLTCRYYAATKALIQNDGYRQFIHAVAGNYVKNYADVRGLGDLEMEAAGHQDGSRWWYQAIARHVMQGAVPTKPYWEDESE